jgi:hypothetical protein
VAVAGRLSGPARRLPDIEVNGTSPRNGRGARGMGPAALIDRVGVLHGSLRLADVPLLLAHLPRDASCTPAESSSTRLPFRQEAGRPAAPRRGRRAGPLKPDGSAAQPRS